MVLLDRLKAIEDRLGRVKTIEKGPRSIDLDILLYGNLSMTTDRLTIPHPLMTERGFVLRPLREQVQSLILLPAHANFLQFKGYFAC
jgi:2-amino-4-hydroxy-6-hydroxymethyldihydropteridine diphosphokinase/dihydropteroate synthase